MASFTSESTTMDEDDELFTSILSLCETDHKSSPTEDGNDEKCNQDEAEISQSVSLSPIKHATPLRISDVLKNKNESFTDKFTPKRKSGVDLFKSMLLQCRNTSTPLMDRWSLTGKSRGGKRRHDVDVIDANLETISEQEFSSDEENTVCCDDDAEKTYDDLLQDLSVLCEKELTEKWETVKTERPENKIKAEHQISRINLENILLETSKVSGTVKETTKETNKPAPSEPGRFTGVNITTQSSLLTTNDSNSFEDADDILGLDDFLGSDDDDDNDYDSLLEDTLFQDDDDTIMYRSVSNVLSSTVQSRSVQKADSVQKVPTYKSISCTTSSSGTANSCSKPNTSSSPTHIQSPSSDASYRGTSLTTNLIPACSAVSTTIASDLLSKSSASSTLGSIKYVCTLSSLSTDSKALLPISASENSTIHSSHSSVFDHNSLQTISMYENSTIHKAASSLFDHSSLQTISVYENSSRSNCTVVSAPTTSSMEIASDENENKEQAMNVDQELVLDSNRLINVQESESECQEVVSESDRSSQVQETVSESDTLSQDDQKIVSESDKLSQKEEFTLDLSKDSDELDEFLQREGFKVIDDLKTGSLGGAGSDLREDQRSLTSQSSVTDTENKLDKLDDKAQEIFSNDQNKSFEKEPISSTTGASDGLVRKNVNKLTLQNVRNVVDKVVTWQASCSEQHDVDEIGSKSPNVSGQKDRKVLPHVQVHPFKTDSDTGCSLRPSGKKEVTAPETLTVVKIEMVGVGETPGVPSLSPSTTIKGKSASCVKVENNNTDTIVSCVKIENNMDQNQNIVTPSLYHDYEAERRFIHGENDLMKEVMRKWGSLGIQTPDTNLSFSNRLRKTKPHRLSRLEGQKISTLWIESPDKHLHSKEAKRFRSDLHAQMNNINNLKQQLQDLNRRVREEVDQTMFEFEEKQNALDRVFVQRKHALNAQQQLELCQTHRHINPYMVQCQLLQLRCEHQHQRDQLTYIFNTEMNQLKNDHQEHVHMIRSRFEQRAHQLKSFIEQLANVESAQTDPQYGPHVLTQLVKGPCRSNNRQSSVVTVCLPADIATAIIKEDEIYDVHYVHPKQ